jgi:hypothetical protein
MAFGGRNGTLTLLNKNNKFHPRVRGSDGIHAYLMYVTTNTPPHISCCYMGEIDGWKDRMRSTG